MLRALTRSIFGKNCGASFCSTSMQRTLRRPRSTASVNPVGPPPPMRTWVSMLAEYLIPRRAVAEQDVDGLDLGVAEQLVDALFASKARILEAAEGCAVEMAGRAIDPDITRLHRARGAQRGAQVVGKDRGSEPVLGRI